MDPSETESHCFSAVFNKSGEDGEEMRMFLVVDSHTMGEPTRVVLDGVEKIPGATMADKRQFLINNLDHVRTALMHEPRGHDNMFGSIIVEPCNPEAHLGVIFMDCGGYLNMCGHGTIGVVTVALEMGLLERREPFTTITLDTPAGLIYARAESRNGRVKKVTVQGVPSFLYREDFPIEIPGAGTIRTDVAFGGNWFALVESRSLHSEVVPANVRRLTEIGMVILQRVNEEIRVVHPTERHLRSIDLVEICGLAGAGHYHEKNIVVFGRGQFDRSPCGTGTCARMASLFFKGRLGLGQDFTSESIIGTSFSGRLLRKTMVGEIEAVVPEITGQAFITGIQQLVLDPDDPLKHGFLI